MQYVLFVQEPAHVAALPAAAEALKAQNVERLWLLFSPAVLVDYEAVSAELDKQIESLKIAKEQAKAADDLDAAKDYKQRLDAAILEKNAKVKDSWKNLDEKQRDAAFDRVFGAFFGAKPVPTIRPEPLADHYETAQIIDALNSKRKTWWTPFAPGTFLIAWPTSFAHVSVPATGAPAAPQVPAQVLAKSVTPKTEETKPLVTQQPRFKELIRMGLDGLAQHAMKIGVNPNQHPTPLGLAHAVFKKEKETEAVSA